MKKCFIEPEMEVQVFAVEDVIASSSGELKPDETPDW